MRPMSNRTTWRDSTIVPVVNTALKCSLVIRATLEIAISFGMVLPWSAAGVDRDQLDVRWGGPKPFRRHSSRPRKRNCLLNLQHRSVHPYRSHIEKNGADCMRSPTVSCWQLEIHAQH